MGGIRQILIVLAFFLFLLSFPARSEITTESDLVNSTTSLYAPTGNPYLTPGSKQALPIKSLLTSEIILKSNLNRLSYLGHGTYLDSYEPMQQLFNNINRYPEESKNRMFLLAIGGSIAKEALRYSRRELSKRNLGFIFPNLSGLNMRYRVEKLQSSVWLRISNTDRNIILSIYNGKITANWHELSYAKQKNIALQPMPGLQIFYLNTIYPSMGLHEFGVAGYFRKLNLYINYVKNFSFPERNRLSVVSYLTL